MVKNINLKRRRYKEYTKIKPQNCLWKDLEKKTKYNVILRISKQVQTKLLHFKIKTQRTRKNMIE